MFWVFSLSSLLYVCVDVSWIIQQMTPTHILTEPLASLPRINLLSSDSFKVEPLTYLLPIHPRPRHNPRTPNLQATQIFQANPREESRKNPLRSAHTSPRAPPSLPFPSPYGRSGAQNTHYPLSTRFRIPTAGNLLNSHLPTGTPNTTIRTQSVNRKPLPRPWII